MNSEKFERTIDKMIKSIDSVVDKDKDQLKLLIILKHIKHEQNMEMLSSGTKEWLKGYLTAFGTIGSVYAIAKIVEKIIR